jgi:hypothetical protein
VTSVPSSAFLASAIEMVSMISSEEIGSSEETSSLKDGAPEEGEGGVSCWPHPASKKDPESKSRKVQERFISFKFSFDLDKSLTHLTITDDSKERKEANDSFS